MKKFLYYLTNNLETSRHEAEWDIGFWITATIVLVWAIHKFLGTSEEAWIPLAILFYIEFWDWLRHNRT